MMILCDSREQKNKHVTDYFDKNGIQHVDRVGFEVGDYREFSNRKLVIDRKQHLSEVCGNVCQQHDRFQREMLRAKELGIQLVILVEHGRGVRSIDDVEGWINPRLKKNPRATTGATLAKVMRTMQERYGVRWEFTTKAECGARIVEILGGQDGRKD
ncbi:MAG: hypothetical protein EOM37_12290 [Proteobacteria bacterium]|nr:hypothetical protein [Pseudomonadota bacterium]